jgi:hypothetical protein
MFFMEFDSYSLVITGNIIGQLVRKEIVAFSLLSPPSFHSNSCVEKVSVERTRDCERSKEKIAVNPNGTTVAATPAFATYFRHFDFQLVFLIFL